MYNELSPTPANGRHGLASKRMFDLISGNGFAQEGYPVRSLFSIPFKGLNGELLGSRSGYTAGVEELRILSVELFVGVDKEHVGCL